MNGETDEEKISRLERENDELRRQIRIWGHVEDKYGLPDYRLIPYQVQMIRDAIEYILTYDTLKGLGEK